MKKILFIATASISLFACTPKTAEITEKVEPSFPNEDVAMGDKLYVENCGKCHGLKTVTDYTPEQWKKIVPNMAAKAKIDSDADNKILQYVLWKTENK